MVITVNKNKLKIKVSVQLIRSILAIAVLLIMPELDGEGNFNNDDYQYGCSVRISTSLVIRGRPSRYPRIIQHEWAREVLLVDCATQTLSEGPPPD